MNENGAGQSLDENNLLAEFVSCLSSALTVDDAGGLFTPRNYEESANKIVCLFSDSIRSDTACCSIPSLDIMTKDRKSYTPASSNPNDTTKAFLEAAAASNLAEVVELRRSELASLPNTLIRNVIHSFMSLVYSRVRSYINALSIQANKDPSNSLSPVRSMLLAFSDRLIKPTTIVSCYFVAGESTLEGGKLISRLVHETVIDLHVLGEVMSVSVSGCGSICGVFDGEKQIRRLSNVSISLDTMDLLRSMMAKARDSVKRATSRILHLHLLSVHEQDRLPKYNHEEAKSYLNHLQLSGEQSGAGEMQKRSMSPSSSPSSHQGERFGPSTRSEENRWSTETELSYGRSLKGLDLLTRAAFTLKHTSNDDTFHSSKPHGLHHGLHNFEEM